MNEGGGEELEGICFVRTIEQTVRAGQPLVVPVEMEPHEISGTVTVHLIEAADFEIAKRFLAENCKHGKKTCSRYLRTQYGLRLAISIEETGQTFVSKALLQPEVIFSALKTFGGGGFVSVSWKVKRQIRNVKDFERLMFGGKGVQDHGRPKHDGCCCVCG